MRHLILFILLASLLSASSASAACPWEDGGYCVDTIARETLKAIQVASDPATETARKEMAAKLTLPEVQTTTEGLSGGSIYFNFYDVLWSSGVLADKKVAYDEAAAAGGTKIGGVNLVVLGARTLQRMVELNWLTMPQAQAILELSRRK